MTKSYYKNSLGFITNTECKAAIKRCIKQEICILPIYKLQWRLANINNIQHYYYSVYRAVQNLFRIASTGYSLVSVSSGELATGDIFDISVTTCWQPDLHVLTDDRPAS